MEDIKTNPPAQSDLPNAKAVLTLGILSVVLCWCQGIFGIIMAIIALVLASRDMALYNAEPGKYSPGSYSNLRTGRTIAIIGLVVAGLFLFALLIGLFFLGLNYALFPWDMIDELTY